MSQSSIYAHFHPDEHGFVDQALDWIMRVSRNHESKLTDFLDPRQQFIVQTLVNRADDVQIEFAGGYANAERKRAVIAPDYAYLGDVEYEIEVLAITSDDVQFVNLDHGDFLGAILGLGIKRDKIGDIHVHDQLCHVLIASGMSDFVRLQLQSVHRAKVLTELLPVKQLQVVETQFEELQLSVASLRLDAVISEVIRLSRNKVLPPIRAGRCRVNWRVTENPSELLKEGDVVSLQGFGRFKLLALAGESKRGRLRIRVGKYV